MDDPEKTRPAPGRRQRSVRRSRWTVIASLAAISFIVGGAGAAAIGLFIAPMMNDLNLSNAVVSGAATAFNLAGLLAAPSLGVALDKFGPRPIVIFGVLATSTGFLWASYCQTRSEMLGAFACAGVGYVASFYVPAAVVIANWMQERKNVGMGIVWGATSLGAALFSVLIGRWIEAYGWRVTSELIAGLVAAVSPLAWLTIQTRQHDAGLVDGSSEGGDTVLARNQILLSHDFIVATTSSALFAIGMLGIYYHIVSVLIEAGYSASSAGVVFGASWILSGLGGLVLGAAAERLGARAILRVGLCTCAVGTLFLLGAGETMRGRASVVMFVVFWGASANCVNQFIPVILAERFGTEALGTLVGVQSSVMGAASAGAPIVTGLLYDRFSDYRISIYASAAAMFLAFVMVSLIKATKPAGNVGRQVGIHECP